MFIERISEIEKEVSSLLNKLGHGSGCNPKDSGELHAIKRAFLKPDKSGHVLDVGAYHGEFSLLAHSVDPNYTYHCFEPDASVFLKLVKATQGKEFRCYQSAISDRDGEAVLYNHVDDSGLSSLCKRDLRSHGADFSREQNVSTVKLSTFMRRESIEKIAYLKLDTEGTEYSILSDNVDLLASGAIENLQFEFGGCNIDSRTYMRDFYNLLTPFYNLYRIHPEGLITITAYSEALEIFQTSNYFCELK